MSATNTDTKTDSATTVELSPIFEAASLLIQAAVKAGPCEPSDIKKALIECDRLTRVCAFAKANLLMQAEHQNLVSKSGARNSADWLNGLLGNGKGSSYGTARTAKAIEDVPSVGDALLDGSINDDQAKIIADTANKTEASADDIDKLLDKAKSSGVDDTKQAAQDLEDKLTGPSPEEKYQTQRKRRRFSIQKQTATGMYQLHGLLDPIVGAQLRKEILRLANSMGTEDDRAIENKTGDQIVMKRSYQQLMADALEQLALGSTPDIGTVAGAGSAPGRLWEAEPGAATGTRHNHPNAANPRAPKAKTGMSVVVTVTLQELQKALAGVGSIAGTEIPAGEIRRLAAEHGVIPAVMGGPSQVLDLGRLRRFASDSQRLAAQIENIGCVFAGCDVSFEHTDMHHVTYWRSGGKTDHEHLAPLCDAHHHKVHDDNWQIIRQPDGTWKTIPPP